MDEHGLSAEGQARRRFLKQAGTVAWATPLIVTMLSRTPAQAQLPAICGTKIDDIGTIACVVTNPCGSALVCRASPLGRPGSTCLCVSV